MDGLDRAHLRQVRTHGPPAVVAAGSVLSRRRHGHHQGRLLQMARSHSLAAPLLRADLLAFFVSFHRATVSVDRCHDHIQSPSSRSALCLRRPPRSGFGAVVHSCESGVSRLHFLVYHGLCTSSAAFALVWSPLAPLYEVEGRYV